MSRLLNCGAQGNSLSVGSPERKSTGTKPATDDFRSSSPIEHVSRRLASLKLPTSKHSPTGMPKPKRAHTVPVPCPAFLKGRNRRSEPIPRTLPYEAPYFAIPPEPILSNNHTSKHPHRAVCSRTSEGKNREQMHVHIKLPPHTSNLTSHRIA